MILCSKAVVLRSLALVMSSTLIVACQGGGGGSTKKTSEVQEPVVVAEPVEVTEPVESTDPVDATDPAESPEPAPEPEPTPEPDDGTTAGSGGAGYAVLRWQEPSRNTDGSTLRDLVGYKVSYGLSPGVYNETLNVDMSEVDCDQDSADLRVCRYTVSDLSSASWYFAVQATDMDGNDSAFSNEVVITVQ